MNYKKINFTAFLKNLILVITLLSIVLVFMFAALQEKLEAQNFHLIYVVQSGDTISEISAKYDVSVDKLKEWNDIESSTSLRIGDEIEIPSPDSEPERNFDKNLADRDYELSLDLPRSRTVKYNPSQEQPDISEIESDDIITYHVRRGDTIYEIARRFNTSMGVITSLNEMSDTTLRQGDDILVPVSDLSRREVLSRSISDEEFDLLARIIHGEARGEPYNGKVAVGAVVINRVLNPRFPDSITEVIYDQGQFSPVQDGSYRARPDHSSRQAAREALDGKDPTGGALFFYNPDKATDRAWTQNREKIVTIGNHVFMK